MADQGKLLNNLSNLIPKKKPVAMDNTCCGLPFNNDVDSLALVQGSAATGIHQHDSDRLGLKYISSPELELLLEEYITILQQAI